MAIIYRNQIRDRNKIVFYGEMPCESELLEFKNRRFFTEEFNALVLEEIGPIAAFVITQSPEKEKSKDYLEFLKENATKLLDSGCQILVRLTNDGRKATIGRLVRLNYPIAGLTSKEAEYSQESMRPEEQNFPPFPHIRIFNQLSWMEVAIELAAIPFDKIPKTELEIEIIGQKQSQTASAELLLRRAFYDCVAVRLVPLLDGLSGVFVYRAYATLPIGSHRQYFVKLGDRNEIFKEYYNYVEHVRDCIPFHLGPHLASDRCCLGANQGIIVGDFVGESESLHSCASDGRATHAIASLFNQTLNGWYIRSSEDARSIGTLLTPLFPKNDPPPARFTIAKQLGATKSLEELLLIIKCCELAPVRVGPTHGDLHAKNVLVRTTEAIVIDFLKYKDDNPLVYDAACLEVGLLVDGFAKDKRDVYALLTSIKRLYSSVDLRNIPVCDHPVDQSFWFYNCISQIRIQARQMQIKENQYAAALAVALLRRACKDDKFDKSEEERRAAAFFLAEQVLVNTFGLEA